MISNEELVGKVIEDVYGYEHKLVRYVGGGGQGRVFLTADPTNVLRMDCYFTQINRMICSKH